jgi:3-deoxy-manno-octulosonate cytidylyltransferase (CMP-KDO synthetase)
MNLNDIHFLGVIPARYHSTRLPGKPLAVIEGKTMIRRVYERAASVFKDLVVATDNEMILNEVKKFGGECVLTSDKHSSGTSRCCEALEIYEKKTRKTFDVLINIQGDEPFIETDQLVMLKKSFVKTRTQIATLIKKIDSNEDLFNPSKPKVVINRHGEALFFSRQAIPHVRGIAEHEWLHRHEFYKHIGVYAYRTNVLRKIVLLPCGKLEKTESLEQLNWLESGYKIMTEITETESFSVDTPEDLECAREIAHSQKK